MKALFRFVLLIEKRLQDVLQCARCKTKTYRVFDIKKIKITSNIFVYLNYYMYTYTIWN